jgi:hypothetical protein
LLNVSEEGDDRFLVSELFKRFNGFWCSCGFVIINDFVLLFIEVEDSFAFLVFICVKLDKLQISYKDKFTLFNLSKHWNFESSGGTETVDFNGFSERESLIFNGGTRWDGCGRELSVSINKDKQTK